MGFYSPPEERQLAPPSSSAGLASWPAYPLLTATPGNVLSIADAYACVRALAEAALSVPLIPYRRLSAGRTRAPGGRVVRLLERPAPGTTQAGLIGSVMAHLNLYGNAFIGKFRGSGEDEIEQLALIHPDLIVVAVERGEPVYNYSPPDRGRVVRLTTRDVIHVHAMSTDGLEGLSPVRQARTILGLSGQLAEHAESFFENSARPSGILKLQRFGNQDDVLAELRDAFEARHGGQGNAHRVAVVAGDVDFEQLSMPLDDAQFLEQRKLSSVEVARIFRVPPWMIGADSGESLTYSNVESQSLSFVTYSLRPWLVAIEQAISADSDLCPGSLYVEFLLDALLRADSAARASFYTAALNPQTGWMTRAEVRQRENLEPESSAHAPAAPVVQLVSATNGNG